MKEKPALVAPLSITVSACGLVADAARCIDGEYSPLDCHNDIPQGVAWLVGFYEGRAEEAHSDKPITLALNDLTAMLAYLKENA